MWIAVSLVVSCLCQEEPKQKLDTHIQGSPWGPSLGDYMCSMESPSSRSLDQEGKLLLDRSKMP